MKRFFGIILTSAILGGMMQSCQSEEGFFEDGQGLLKMKMVINNSLTRAEETAGDSLAEKCIIYVSSEKGLIYRFKGIDNVPSDLYLKSGSYVAEAWTGDSVTASFDKKFYKAYEPFDITKGDVKQVILNCKIANVVASINPDPIIAEALQNYKVTIGNTRGSLEFNEENALTTHGYFMMPNNDTSLTWTITGQRENGEEFSKSGIIENVEPAHEYILNIHYTPTESTIGGAFITVTVDETELIIEDTVQIQGAPVISGIGYDISEPLKSAPGKFIRNSVYVQASGELTTMKMITSDYAALGLSGGEYDFILMQDDAKLQLESEGVSYESTFDSENVVTNARISFSEELLNRLPNGRYAIDFNAVDSNGKATTKRLTIEVSDAGVELIETPWYEVYARKATLHAVVKKEDMLNPGFRYRKVGETQWTEVKLASVGANTDITTTLTSLEPGTQYEYQAIADGYVNSESMYFMTESIFVLPNASFEHWCNGGVKNALMPNQNANNIFWDSGNQGATMVSVNLSDKSTDMVHSGTYSAKLASEWCGMFGMGAFSAGNTFSGECTNVVVSANPTAELTFGRPYNNSRPAKLKGWANYRPGVIDYCSTDLVSEGDIDQSHIYVALTSAPVYVNPANGSYFNQNDEVVLAYGEIIWTGNFGPDGQLQEFEIPIVYKESATTIKPLYIVIQMTASRYGDYFTGSTSSVLYIDDLELVYE